MKRPIRKQTYRVVVYKVTSFPDEYLYDPLWSRKIKRTEEEGFFLPRGAYNQVGTTEHQIVVTALEEYAREHNPGTWKKVYCPYFKGSISYRTGPNTVLIASLERIRRVNTYPEYQELVSS